MMKIKSKIILCDIEGTTTSINFVKNVLFPYSHQKVNNYLKENWNNSAIKTIVSELIELRNDDNYHEAFKNAFKDDIADENQQIENISNLIKYFIEKDYKIGPLKNLQGLMWEDGYKSEKFKGHVYDDVPVAFEKWYKTGIKIYIYSSGSVKAQKLLFEYSDHGNLLKYINGHFDTAIGYKQNKQSYINILKELNENYGENVIFFTDIPNEAIAAKSANIKCILLDRPGNVILSENDRNSFPVIKSFDQIDILLAD